MVYSNPILITNIYNLQSNDVIFIVLIDFEFTFEIMSLQVSNKVGEIFVIFLVIISNILHTS